jgi:hypothetical protein
MAPGTGKQECGKNKGEQGQKDIPWFHIKQLFALKRQEARFSI